MRNLSKSIVPFLFFCLVIQTVGWTQEATPMLTITSGKYTPLYGGTEQSEMEVNAFKLDEHAVTNEQFVAFLRKNPEYQKSKIKGIYATKSYLAHWESDLNYGNLVGNAPVTNVSWFVARKYCECEGKRLPTMDEWEYVAMSDATKMDARTKEAYNKYILSWYEAPKTFLNPVKSTFKNYWGIYDMHGLIWEWVYDYNSIFLSGASSNDKGNNDRLFCGSASINATDLMDYAAFMRYGFRSSLKANFTTKNLGFRCAKNL